MSTSPGHPNEHAASILWLLAEELANCDDPSTEYGEGWRDAIHWVQAQVRLNAEDERTTQEN